MELEPALWQYKHNSMWGGVVMTDEPTRDGFPAIESIPYYSKAQLQQAILNEREACSKLADELAEEQDGYVVGKAIRARSDAEE